MANKKALVTGGNRGIGRGIVTSLVQDGYDVVFTYHSEQQDAENLTRELDKKYDSKVLYYAADFNEKQTPGVLVHRAWQDLGHLDLLVNNAGAFLRTGKLFCDTPPEEIDQMLMVNFRGYLMNMWESLRLMMKHGVKGNIINITSHRAIRPYSGDMVYGGIKAGITRATQSLALEGAPYGIRANCVAPGAIRYRTREEYLRQGSSEDEIEAREKLSRKIPLGRMGEPWEIGEAVVWLASEKAAYITGESIRVDGGLCMPGIPERAPSGDYEDLGWCFLQRKKDTDMENW
ncbi:glucose 1-dehydrogenase 2 [Spirochaetia bacterium]|nr:glucose 1-dehydrogenase 2 [Spirochaetia bacterium]